jgi:hypothetical protein
VNGSPTARRYSPNSVKNIELRITQGQPNEALISTSRVERMNLTIRMGMPRFTRLTNAFSKKVENLAHAVTLQFMYYNVARPHFVVRQEHHPGGGGGISDHVWILQEIAALLD